MKINLAELRAAAEKGTPGPWRVEGRRDSWSVHTRRSRRVHIQIASLSFDGLDHESDARHIANCDPQTILALIEAVEAAQAVVGENPGTPIRGRRKLRVALAPFTEDSE